MAKLNFFLIPLDHGAPNLTIVKKYPPPVLPGLATAMPASNGTGFFYARPPPILSHSSIIPIDSSERRVNMTRVGRTSRVSTSLELLVVEPRNIYANSYIFSREREKRKKEKRTLNGRFVPPTCTLI